MSNNCESPKYNISTQSQSRKEFRPVITSVR